MNTMTDATGFWAIALLLLLGVGALLIASLVLARRNATAPEPELAQDIRLYREQLATIERDQARGILSDSDAERLRVEIGRRLLESDRAGQKAAAGTAGRGRGEVILSAVIIAATLLAGAAIYMKIGRPGQPDQPLASRISAAAQQIALRPSQADYIRMLAPIIPAEPDPDMAEPLARLRESVDPATSDSIEGLELRARIEAQLGNFAPAIAAQSRLIALRGPAASDQDHSDLVLMLVDQAQGYVSPEAEAALLPGLGLNSRQDLDRVADLLLSAAQGFAPQGEDRRQLEALPDVTLATGPLYLFAGELYAQNGRADRAFALWRLLLENGPAEGFWTSRLAGQVRAAAWVAGAWDYQPPETAAPPALRGPDADALAAASGLNGDETRSMAEGMVAGLKSRLLSEGGSVAEWTQLIRALSVLGQEDEAREVVTLAQKAHPDAAAQAEIGAAAQTIGTIGTLP
ncbi:c-type cytochrome biogenesis protein CcmI [Xinfangfangia sp. D13-10-4-6]|uniref:c-type cytochrome biogenesis protein CcmI n=1 Tax=Pseudogemmobacter hezensis TaxID=2737662 RepID=UPI00155302A1|nr:c-type cytochrome biogenesis protein CcmI [Pseudogemmobacter hezensis]NPD13711.1 c-type cytochrome biogenesis protein CcmI [Pseudogemmobacter hezensis]